MSLFLTKRTLSKGEMKSVFIVLYEQEMLIFKPCLTLYLEFSPNVFNVLNVCIEQG
jgi:hypothetical protein